VCTYYYSNFNVFFIACQEWQQNFFVQQKQKAKKSLEITGEIVYNSKI